MFKIKKNWKKTTSGIEPAACGRVSLAAPFLALSFIKKWLSLLFRPMLMVDLSVRTKFNGRLEMV